MTARARRFVVCIHDATPAYDRETRVMIGGLAPLIGRRLSFGVVPDWHGEWPLAAYPEYCRLLRASSGELLLHGYFHRRRRGSGPIALLTGSSDEMNGLDREETRAAIERGQRVFTEVFGAPARGFLAPAWQVGHVRLAERDASGDAPGDVSRDACRDSFGVEHVLGFFSLESRTGRKIPLATWAWDCGRWSWLGHVGDGIGRLLHSLERGDRRIPTLAIHPKDLERGFWPKILRLTEDLLDAGYEPSTPSMLFDEGREC